jgi:hypothetical protein
MVYKKYIIRKGKRFGPYYCESYRDKDGKVKTRFVSGPKKRHKIIKKIKEKSPNLDVNLKTHLHIGRKSLIVMSITFLILVLLTIGNISYYTRHTGNVISSEDLSQEEFSEISKIVEKIEDHELKSNINVEKEVEVEITEKIFENKRLEFDTLDGEIALEFDLLDYGEWAYTEKEKEVDAERFDIDIQKSSEKYKWGYNVRLNSLDFMARIDVYGESNITIADNKTLMIGNNYLSFNDLVEQGYSVTIESPVLLDEIEIVEVNETEENDDEITINETNVSIPSENDENISISPQNDSNTDEYVENTIDNSSLEDDNLSDESNETEVTIEINLTIEDIEEESEGEGTIIGGAEEPTEADEEEDRMGEEDNEETEIIEKVEEEPELTSEEELASITGNTIKNIIEFIVKGYRGITGFFVNGMRGLTGNVILEENKISIYIQKQFGNVSSSTGENYQIGDVINLDPELFVITVAGDNGTATDGNIVYQCGTINQSGSFTMNQSIIDNTLTGNCITITTQNITLDCAGYYIQSDNYHSGIYSDQVNTTIKNCNVSMLESVLSIDLRGIYLNSAHNSTVQNCTLSSVAGSNALDLRSDNCVIQSVNVTEGILNLQSADYNLIENFILNSSSESLLLTSSSSNTFDNGAISLGGYGVKIHPDSGSSHNIFREINISDSSTDVYISSEGSGDAINNSFINCSYDISKESVSGAASGDLQLFRKWYFQTKVNDTNGNVLNNANVSAYDKDNDLIWTTNTNSSGWINITEIVDYVNLEGSRTYYSNYTIYAYNSTHVGNVSYNVTQYENKLNNVITVDVGTFVDPSGKIDECKTLDNDNVAYNLTGNIINNSLTTDCIIVSAENVTVDCVNYSNYILSDDNVAGIYSNKENTIIRNCNISMGSQGQGIKLEGAISSQIINNTLNNHFLAGYGIYMTGNLTNSQIINNTFENNTYGVMLYNSAAAVINSSNLSIKNNLAKLNSIGLDLMYSPNSLIENNQILNTTSSEIAVQAIQIIDSDNTNLINNTIKYTNNTRNTGENGYSTGLEIISSNYVNLTKNIIIQNFGGPESSWGFSLSGSHAIITENNFTNNFNRGTVSFADVRVTSGTNNSFINCSFDSESVSSGELSRKWYYRAHTEDVAGTDIDNATVDLYNGIDTSPYISLTTNASGWTNITNIIDYVNTGGTKTYYDTSVIAANYNLTLWDDHIYNVTDEQNNLNDSFILDIDITPPVMGGYLVSMSTGTADNSYVVVINWTTDDPSNSSVIYWGASSGNGGDNVMKVNNHGIIFSGLMNNSNYNFNYTSCDFAGNCNTSSGSFATSDPDIENIPSTGSGLSCVSNWQCNVCTSSSGDIGSDGSQSCTDINECNPLVISKIKPCKVQESYFAEDEDETPSSPGFSSPSGSGGPRKGCTSNFECSEWSNCMAVYDLGDIIGEKVLLDGEKQRKCIDKNNCEYDKFEREECVTKLPVYAKKVFRCNENYIEIYDSRDILISRMKLVDGIYQKLDIQMLFDEFGYCPYCYDGQKNYDEDEVDCQYSGVDCPRCSLETPFLRQNYSLILISLVGLTFFSFLFIIWYLLLWKRTKKKIKKIKKMTRL